jgi:threonine/homoserine/homoserine lactone efflux protein
MTLLIILGLVFLAVILMVVLGERFGKPMEQQEQVKYSKWTRILVFSLIIIAIVKMALE